MHALLLVAANDVEYFPDSQSAHVCSEVAVTLAEYLPGPHAVHVRASAYE